jgi:transposase InsO family protein
MNIHKNARLTLARRLELVLDITVRGVSPSQAALTHGVSAPTARKWLGRYLAMGCDGLTDASSRPALSPKAISAAKALAIVELRRKRLTQARIAAALGVAKSTVSRVLARAGLSRLSDLQPAEPVVRYEHEEPGQMLHIDTKKLGRIERPSHRVTGNRRDSVDGAGWEMLFVAIDDHARIAFTEMHPDERTPSAVQFLHNCVAYFRSLGVQVQRLLTDNGSAFRSRDFAQACRQLGVKHQFTRSLPTTDQRQGRALYSISTEGVGIRLHLPELSTTHRRPGLLESSLQLAPPAPRGRGLHSHVQAQALRKQPVDTSQLEARNQAP